MSYFLIRKQDLTIHQYFPVKISVLNMEVLLVGPLTPIYTQDWEWFPH